MENRKYVSVQPSSDWPIQALDHKQEIRGKMAPSIIDIPRIDNTWPRANVYYTDTGNMHCMPQGHVPSVSEIYLGSGLCVINPGENYTTDRFLQYNEVCVITGLC